MTDKEIGQRQRERVFHFVEGYIGKHGIAPVYSEIQAAVGISTSHIKYILGRLHESGKIIRMPGVIRGIKLPVKKVRPVFFSTPIIGTIAAGTGVSVPETDFALYDWETRIEIPLGMVPKGVDKNSVYALQVQGYSMRDDGVLDGDLVIGQMTDQWNVGDMVAAWLVDEKLATLKRIERTDRLNVRLVPANKEFQPRIFEENKVLVQARIFAVYHRFWE